MHIAVATSLNHHGNPPPPVGRVRRVRTSPGSHRPTLREPSRSTQCTSASSPSREHSRGPWPLPGCTAGRPPNAWCPTPSWPMPTLTPPASQPSSSGLPQRTIRGECVDTHYPFSAPPTISSYHLLPVPSPSSPPPPPLPLPRYGPATQVRWLQDARPADTKTPLKRPPPNAATPG